MIFHYMSVIATYARLDPTSLDECRTNPDWIEALDDKAIPNCEVIDIDKACDGLVWLLSRLPPPQNTNIEGAGFVLQQSLAPLLHGVGGTLEPQLDAPYGPASSLSPEQVIAFDTWLRSATPALIRPLYRPDAMDSESVYPQIWKKEGLAALEEYLLPNLQTLKEFFARAAQAGQHIIVYFT
jgi:hypothetical protein